MKRISIFFLSIFCCIAATAQTKFVLQPDLSTLTEDGKDYVIVLNEGKTQSELYQQTLSTIKRLPNISPESILCDEDNSIIVSGFDPKTFSIPGPMMTQTFGIHYQLQFQFKDGRIKVVAPKVTGYQMGTFKVEGTYALVHNSRIFVNGAPGKSKKAQVAIESITRLLNKAVNDIIYPTETEW